MKASRGVRLRKFKLRKIILGVRMHFRHTQYIFVLGPNAERSASAFYCTLNTHYRIVAYHIVDACGGHFEHLL